MCLGRWQLLWAVLHQHQPNYAKQPQTLLTGQLAQGGWISWSRLQSTFVQEALCLFLHSFTKAELTAWLAAPSYKYPRKVIAYWYTHDQNWFWPDASCSVPASEEGWTGHKMHVLTGTWLTLAMSNWPFWLWKTELNYSQLDNFSSVVDCGSLKFWRRCHPACLVSCWWISESDTAEDILYLKILLPRFCSLNRTSVRLAAHQTGQFLSSQHTTLTNLCKVSQT